jgi:hypothetical protein
MNNNILSDIDNLVQQQQITVSFIEKVLGVNFNKSDKLSNSYTTVMQSNNSNYKKIELRIFQDGTRFFLLIYPSGGVSINVDTLKKKYTYISYTPPDNRRQELATYTFSAGGKQLNLSVEENSDKMILASIEGQILKQ